VKSHGLKSVLPFILDKMDYTIYINQYLDNELSPEERQAFETALASDEILQKNLSQEQAIREQFEFEKTKLGVLALHEQKKKKAEQERLIQQQFDYQKTQAEVLALHERKKTAQNKATTVVSETPKVAKMVSISWRRYAIAASLIGVAIIGAWQFNQKNNSQGIVSQEVTTPKIDVEPQVLPPSDKTIAENKEEFVSNKPAKKVQKPADNHDDIKPSNWQNPANAIAFNEFYDKQLRDVRSGTMGANDTDIFEKAKILLKNEKSQAAYDLLITLYEKEPNDAEFTLFLALASYKLNKIPEAIELLKSLKEKNLDVKAFLERIK
jgi:hypothetical protein